VLKYVGYNTKVTERITDNNYKVLCKNKEYPVRSDFMLNVGDLVWICAPGNDWDSLYVQNSNSMRNYEFRADGIYLNGRKITN